MMKPGDCDRCVSLRERIAELEAEVERLRKIAGQRGEGE